MTILDSCKKDEEKEETPTATGQVPVLTTSAISSISYNTASGGGNITTEGGSAITARGVCWSTGATPSITDNKTTDGSGVGSFTSAITGLTASTSYYVRAYATNTTGTGYGSAVQFTSLALPVGTVTDIDGNIYNTVTIGTQVWMTENLKVTKYRNGDDIPNVTDGIQWNGLTTGAYCIYDNVSANVNTYGLLYNWYAITDSRNICPTGWHVPTDAEWNILEKYLDNTVDTTFTGTTGTDIGGKLKETGSLHWATPNTGATNSSGFTALPGGWRGYDKLFHDLLYTGYWWSKTQKNSSSAWDRQLYQGTKTIDRLYLNKYLGLSVRCIKD